MKNTIYDIIILGGGPAGLTAAIYASRAHLDVLVLAGNPPGGQLMLTTDVENYPGFENGIMGPDLIANMRNQAVRFNTKFIDENATSIFENEDALFKVTTEDNAKYTSKALIIATGASAKWLNLESEQKLRGRGVSACATCDGFFFKDKVVGVVGGGDSAMEEAIYLTKFAPKVYVFVRKNKESMKASKFMQKRAFENDKIQFIFNSEVAEVLGEQKVTGVKVLNTNTRNLETIDLEGLFIAIGHKPNTGFLSDFIDTNSLGYVNASKNTSTNRKGVFVAGDVYDSRYRQAVTAAGFGCMAAIDAEKYLSDLKFGPKESAEI